MRNHAPLALFAIVVVSAGVACACAGPPGTAGKNGAPGTNGTDGANGTNGSNGTNGTSAAPCNVVDNGDGTATITCPDGSSATIGGPAAQSGAISGVVTLVDPSDDPTGISVTVQAGTNVFTSATDADGAFTIAVPEGAYVVHFSNAGYADRALTGVAVAAGEATVLDPITLGRGTRLSPFAFAASSDDGNLVAVVDDNDPVA